VEFTTSGRFGNRRPVGHRWPAYPQRGRPRTCVEVGARKHVVGRERRQRRDEQALRATLGRLLFSKEDSNKSVKVISGGEEGRMLFGKLMLRKPNVLVMDEPTNHLDMESIEALNLALENYPGTLIFVSHDREFVASLATRIIEMAPDGIVDFKGSYDDYLRSQGLEQPVARRMTSS
jgi:ATPase subunit of ABC transporter with duplicated ATPase domains